MKKYLSLFIIVAMLLSLIACSNNDDVDVSASIATTNGNESTFISTIESGINVATTIPNITASIATTLQNITTPIIVAQTTTANISIPIIPDDVLAIYVSNDGDDANDGSILHPLKTISEAKNRASKTDKNKYHGIQIILKAGEYRIDSVEFSTADSGTATCPITYRTDGLGDVVINGGITISPELFSPVTDQSMLSRLSDKAKDKVVCMDLSKLGITAKDYGKLYAIGSYCTADKYTGDWVGDIYCELFVNDARMKLAQYPNSSYLKVEKVVKEGNGYEHYGSHDKNPNWSVIVDPESDVFRVSESLAKRINSWKTLNDVWMFCFLGQDWADSSSPIGYFDYETRDLSPKFVSAYGIHTGGQYYFYNVFEELDSPGEWYLDRTTGILYMYPKDNLNTSTIDLSLSTNTLFKGSQVEYITFDGLTVKGTRGDAFNIVGSNITIQNCEIKNISGNAITLEGYNNVVTRNDISHTGKSGITLIGGDTVKVISGNSIATNNKIHDWSEIYKTYQPAVTLKGVGNICSHNEIFNSPHEAITYYGNNHIIEYNKIYKVCLITSDAGAIYAGRSWIYYGNVIRYNYIYDIGSGDFKPNGIYLDDALSGQKVYGNILVNIPGYSILIGGGRDIYCCNNIIASWKGSRGGIMYDSRAFDSLSGGWFTGSLEGNLLYNALVKSPWKTPAWVKAYPEMQKISLDYDDIYNENFICMQGGSVLRNNIVTNSHNSLGYLSSTSKQYSEINTNVAQGTALLLNLFENGLLYDFHIKNEELLKELLPEFEMIPLDLIGIIEDNA